MLRTVDRYLAKSLLPLAALACHVPYVSADTVTSGASLVFGDNYSSSAATFDVRVVNLASGATPTLVAALYRLSRRLPPIDPDPALDHVAGQLPVRPAVGQVDRFHDGADVDRCAVPHLVAPSAQPGDLFGEVAPPRALG